MAVEMKTKPRIILSNQPSLYTAQRKPIGMLSTSTITNEAAANCSVAGRQRASSPATVRAGLT